MAEMYGICALRIIAVFAISTLIMVGYASGQTIAKPSVPEFTIALADHSYDVPSKIVSSTDPYTNKTTTTTVNGYHIDNRTIDATIKNNGASYYNFRYKPHYANKWSYYPFNPELGSTYIVPAAEDLSNIYSATATDYTVISLTFLPIPDEGEVDIQIQGLFGDFEKHPSGMLGAGYPTYDFEYIGERSNWSNTQTITIGENSPNPTPTVPELPITAILITVLATVSLLLISGKEK